MVTRAPSRQRCDVARQLVRGSTISPVSTVPRATATRRAPRTRTKSWNVGGRPSAWPVAVVLQLVVQVRHQRAARCADRRDLLTCAHAIADLDLHVAVPEVREHADLARRVLDQHAIAVDDQQLGLHRRHFEIARERMQRVQDQPPLLRSELAARDRRDRRADAIGRDQLAKHQRAAAVEHAGLELDQHAVRLRCVIHDQITIEQQAIVGALDKHRGRQHPRSDRRSRHRYRRRR
jgi:hypothetical protein